MNFHLNSTLFPSHLCYLFLYRYYIYFYQCINFYFLFIVIFRAISLLFFIKLDLIKFSSFKQRSGQFETHLLVNQNCMHFSLMLVFSICIQIKQNSLRNNLIAGWPIKFDHNERSKKVEQVGNVFEQWKCINLMVKIYWINPVFLLFTRSSLCGFAVIWVCGQMK